MRGTLLSSTSPGEDIWFDRFAIEFILLDRHATNRSDRRIEAYRFADNRARLDQAVRDPRCMRSGHVGPRKCIGSTFALQEATLVLRPSFRVLNTAGMSPDNFELEGVISFSCRSWLG